MAKDYLVEEDTLLLESDLIFEEAVLRKLVDDPYPSLALVAKYESWMDGTVVTLDEDDNILDFIGKKNFNFSDTDSYYKTVNIYKFGKEFSNTHYDKTVIENASTNIKQIKSYKLFGFIPFFQKYKESKRISRYYLFGLPVLKTDIKEINQK